MISGATRGRGGGALARHLTSRAKGQRSELVDVRGLSASTTREALDELVASSAHGRTDRPVHHLHVDPPHGWDRADVRDHFLAAYEAEFGLTALPRFIQEHEKNGRVHWHVVYSLVQDDGRMISLSHDRARREKVSRVIEHELGMPLIRGAHSKAVAAALVGEGRLDVVRAMAVAGHLQGPRPVAVTPMQRHQAERTAVDPRAVQAAALTAWKAADSGPALEAALAAADLRLALGDKGPVVIDAAGGAHSLSRILGAASRADGARVGAAAVKARIAGLRLTPAQEVQHAIADARRAAGPEEGRPHADPAGGPRSEGDLGAPAAPVGAPPGGLAGGRPSGADHRDAGGDHAQPEAPDRGRGGLGSEVRRPQRARQAIAVAGLARASRNPRLKALAAELRAASAPARPQRAAEAVAIVGLARVAADPGLKARAAELRDAARPAIERMREALDRRRAAAAIVDAARRPPPVAPEIAKAKARLKAAKAASSRAFYATSKSEDAARLMLRQERPRGFLSWITGRTAAWQRDTAAADRELARILALREAKRAAVDQAQQGLRSAERTAPKPVRVDDQAARRELDLLASAEACLRADPVLARRGEQAVLRAAEDRLRRLEEERIRMELEARRREALRLSREEPRAPRFR